MKAEPPPVAAVIAVTGQRSSFQALRWTISTPAGLAQLRYWESAVVKPVAVTVNPAGFSAPRSRSARTPLTNSWRD